MSDWWTVVGTIASVSGGLFAWYQAHKAKGYAEGMNDAKKEVRGKSVSKNITELNLKSKDIKTQLGPTYIEGKKASEIKTTLNDYLTSYSDLLGPVDENVVKPLVEYYETINRRSSLLSDDDFLDQNIDVIRNVLGQVISTTSKIIDNSTFQ